VSSPERLAVASITGVAEAYAALKRLTWQQAMQEIQDCLAQYKIPAARVTEVLSEAARGYLTDDRHYNAAALGLLLDAGADRTRAEQLREQANRKRVVSFGDATWGG
jgi:hypothetical protein